MPPAAWPLGEDTAETLPSLNDIAVEDDGRVYVISSDEQVIARLEQRLEPDERAKADGTWRIHDLPGGSAAKPEGLALVAGGRPAVGSTASSPATTSCCWTRRTDDRPQAATLQQACRSR